MSKPNRHKVLSAPNKNLAEMTEKELKEQRHRFLRLADYRAQRIEVLKREQARYDGIYAIYNGELQRRKDYRE